MCWYPEFWQTCISAKHIIPPRTTERDGIPGLSRCGSINSASCSKKKASLVLHLEDQAVYRPYPRQDRKGLRSCWPTLPLRRKRVAQSSRCYVSWFSINCLLEGRYGMIAAWMQGWQKKLCQKKRVVDLLFPCFREGFMVLGLTSWVMRISPAQPSEKRIPFQGLY